MTGDAHATRNLAAEYSAIASAYALLWAPVINPMARPLLEALPLRSARHILDLGCGTGDLLADLRSAAPSAQLTGADRAEGMLRWARQSAACGLVVTDAAALALGTHVFDAAVLAFALFHIPDPVPALREVRRVLRRDGVIGIATWGADPGMPGTAIWTQELDASGAAPDSRDAAVMGHNRMNTAPKLASLLQESEFAPPRVWSQWFTHRWTVDALLALQTSCGMPARRLAGLSQVAQASCRERVRVRITELASDDLALRAEVVFAVAHRRG